MMEFLYSTLKITNQEIENTTGIINKAYNKPFTKINTNGKWT